MEGVEALFKIYVIILSLIYIVSFFWSVSTLQSVNLFQTQKVTIDFKSTHDNAREWAERRRKKIK